MGDIEISLHARETPRTVNNCVFLTREGFDNGLKFYRVIEHFMIQTGDPRGDGTGNAGYAFEDEPFLDDYERGAVAMANRGRDTNGSQFFIIQGDGVPERLPRTYTIFGRVTS